MNNSNYYYNNVPDSNRYVSSNPVNLKEAFILFFKNYFNFSGISSRSEYWYAVLGIFIFTLPLTMINSLFTSLAYNSDSVLLNLLAGTISLFILLMNMALVIPSISLIVRRLHDTGREWYYILFTLIPLAGPFIMIYFYTRPSDSLKNQKWRI